MKAEIFKILLVLAVVFGPVIASACEIDFEIVENKKEFYQKGDVIIVNVKVVFTHRQCPEGIDATKFSYDGLKVLGATRWNETLPNTYERKFKIEITENKKGNLVFGAARSCDKDGGSGSISFKVS